MIDEKKLDAVLLELGHDDYSLGTAYIRAGVSLYGLDSRMTKEVYPDIARVYQSTPSRVERCIRHSIEKAWSRGSNDAQLKYFGYSINPNTGKPRNGEYIARLARICREEMEF